MGSALSIDSVELCSPRFAAQHRVALPGAGSTVLIGPEMARGGFGLLHPVEALDGAKPSSALIAKVFHREALEDVGGAARILGNIGRLHEALEHLQDPDWAEELLALPFCLVNAYLDGEGCLVALMLDLRGLGYRHFPSDDPAEAAAYRARDLSERIELCLRYAERAALLEELGFIHGDQNLENIMLNLSNLDVQIIDFDAGVLAHGPADHPLTPGHPDECMPPEVKPAGVAPPNMHLYTLAAERWSVASLIGFLLLGVHPAFFLRNISRSTIEEYAHEARGWPHIDVGGPLFTSMPNGRAAHKWLTARALEMPPRLLRLLRQLFAAGTDAAARPTATDWAEGLAELFAPPVVEYFEVDLDYVPEGAEVILSWSVRNATQVEIQPHGPLPATGTLSVLVERSKTFVLRATNIRQESTVQGLSVRVLPLPRIEILPLPRLPEIAGPGRVPSLPRIAPPTPGIATLVGAEPRADFALPELPGRFRLLPTYPLERNAR